MTTPKLINKTYQVGDQIGKGAFGRVYRGLNIRTGEVVAIKHMEKNLMGQLLDSFLKEVDLLPKLVHPNLVFFTDWYDSDTSLFFILEFVEGGSLREAVKNFGTFPESLMILYLTQILRGLQYLHDQGVAHRHLKGDNILLTKDGMCKLSNFGSCPYTAVQIKASPFWTAPEALEGATPTIKSDVWGIGCCVVELLTGNPPHWELGAALAYTKIQEDPHPPIPPNASPDLEDMLKQCFHRDPKKRITSTALLSHRCLTSIWGTAPTSTASDTRRKKAPTMRLSNLFGRSNTKHPRKGLTELIHHHDDRKSPSRIRSASVVTPPVLDLKKDEELKPKKEVIEEKIAEWYGSNYEEDKKKKKSATLRKVKVDNHQLARKGNEPAVSVGYRKTIDHIEGLLRTEQEAKQSLCQSRIQQKRDLEAMLKKLGSLRESVEADKNWAPKKTKEAVLADVQGMIQLLDSLFQTNENILTEHDLSSLDETPSSPSSLNNHQDGFSLTALVSPQPSRR
eukprot:TRINITY_DN3767_c0_g1_i1.p1 TRINITY_DN3767_c0_g1~~TRINITY_DN3767_c0_g1_i1.p1  ORF type:complete len:508 (+),score=90.50 TRINITY_DN3767_c0_g1_i1:49-1572(+)